MVAKSDRLPPAHLTKGVGGWGDGTYLYAHTRESAAVLDGVPVLGYETQRSTNRAITSASSADNGDSSLLPSARLCSSQNPLDLLAELRSGAVWGPDNR